MGGASGGLGSVMSRVSASEAGGGLAASFVVGEGAPAPAPALPSVVSVCKMAAAVREEGSGATTLRSDEWGQGGGGGGKQKPVKKNNT